MGREGEKKEQEGIGWLEMWGAGRVVENHLYKNQIMVKHIKGKGRREGRKVKGTKRIKIKSNKHKKGKGNKRRKKGERGREKRKKK